MGAFFYYITKNKNKEEFEMYKDIIKDYGYIGASTLGWGPVDYTEEQIDKLMREENVLMETNELTKEELEKIAAEIRLALDNPIKESTTRVKPVVNKVEKKGRKGIQVKGFNYNIATTTNSAIYDSFVAFHGTKKDAWLVWGRFNGTLEKDVNGQKEANFEFFLFENGKLIVTYWKAENYKIVAEKLAKAAIKRLLEANVR